MTLLIFGIIGLANNPEIKSEIKIKDNSFFIKSPYLKCKAFMNKKQEISHTYTIKV